MYGDHTQTLYSVMEHSWLSYVVKVME